LKQKKITIKPFLNKNLAPQDTDCKYPLYYQITYERRNTQVKSHFNTFLIALEGLRGKELEQVKFESNILQRTVAYEQQKIGKAFTLHGIKDKYELYIPSLDALFEMYLKKKLLKAVKCSNSEFLPILKFEGFEVTFTLLYKASKLLVENFNKTLPLEFKEEIEAYQKYTAIKKSTPWLVSYDCVMDWLDSDYRAELKNKLTGHFIEKSTSVEKTMSILNVIVEEKLKNT